jgi:hypothetical protein
MMNSCGKPGVPSVALPKCLERPLMAADSTDQCNSQMESFSRCIEV